MNVWPLSNSLSNPRPKKEKETFFFIYIWVRSCEKFFSKWFERNTRILCVGHCAPYNTVDNSNFFRNHSRIKNVCFMGTSKNSYKSILFAFIYVNFQFVAVTLFTLRSSLYSNNIFLWNWYTIKVCRFIIHLLWHQFKQEATLSFRFFYYYLYT